MIIEHKENITANFAGTIIDIESQGEFDRQYRYSNDSREYQNIRQVIFGFVNQKCLSIFCADGTDAIAELKEKSGKLIDSLPRPLYAFQSGFERGVIFHHLGKRVDFDGELQAYRGEAKINAVMELGISNYNDPFHDVGKLCMIAWMRGEFENAIAHNRACLLKERDILEKRGFRPPDELKFVPAQTTDHD
jgi:hypothetical protein